MTCGGFLFLWNGKPPREWANYEEGITAPIDGTLEKFPGVSVKHLI